MARAGMGTVLVINCGSSTVKYKAFRHADGETSEEFTELCAGLVDRIGIDGSCITHEVPGRKPVTLTKAIATHADGIREMLAILVSREHGVLSSVREIDAVGHRVVHGGEEFVDSTRLDERSIGAIRECIPLAPLHNPHNLAGILACESLKKPQVAVFDTAFHASMPEERYRYAIPRVFYEKYRMRRYGFHGISHLYVAREASRVLGRPFEKLKLITCHLGNGASLTAVRHGKSLENTMGYTPLEGVVMGTRCGSIDPAIPTILAEREKRPPAEIEQLLNTESGLKALAGTRDMRDILERVRRGDREADLAVDIYCSAVAKGIGAYLALLDGADAVVFTAGIGQNAAEVRRRVLSCFTHQGLALDERANQANATVISAEGSRLAALVIPTNEELEICRETRRVLG